jgi:cytochrome P450
MPQRPPGPDGLPVLGCTLSFLDDPFEAYERWAAEYGDVVATDIGSRTFVMVAHPDPIEEVLVTEQDHFVKGDFQRSQLGDIVGDGLLLSEGEFWQAQRERLSPAFFLDRIAEYGETMVGETRTRAEWDSGETIVLNDELQQLSLAIMARTLFGFEISEAEGTFADTARTISERFNLAHLSTYLPEWVPTRRNRRYRRALSDLDTVIYRLIDQRRAASETPDDLLDILVAAADDPSTDIDDESLRDEIATVILGGHDTASLAMTYTLYAVATHPDVEERLLEEIDETLADGDPTTDDLGSLPYLDAVVREAMRLYPPAYTLFREPTSEVELEGYTIPEGATVTIPQWIVHRDGRWYDEPTTFDPDRWIDGLELPEYAYFPFGGGKRQCIGMRYGRMETKLVVATLLQSFRIGHRRPGLLRGAHAPACRGREHDCPETVREAVPPDATVRGRV